MKHASIFIIPLLFFSLSAISQDVEILKINNLRHQDSSENLGKANLLEEFQQSSNGLLWGINKSGFTLLNKDSIIIKDEKFDASRDFNFNRAAVLKDGKWGFVNSNGIKIIPLEYDFVFDFKAPSTAVVKNKKWMIIDTIGKKLVDLDIDYFWGFENGIAKITRGNQYAFIDYLGNLKIDGWKVDSTKVNDIRYDRNIIANDNFQFCPPNLDFEHCDFTNWQCYIGNVRPSSGLVLNPSPPTPNQQNIIQNTGAMDLYGGFPIAPPDGSSCAMRLGNPINGFGAERLEYLLTIPPTVSDYTFMYQYALVFQDPGHQFEIQPRFKVQLTDALSGQELSCASVDYTAGYGGASFFLPSAAGSLVFYKPWTPVFINLGRFYGRTLKLTFTTMDCGAGGHWCYAYLDINQCGFNGLSANNSCSSPNTTTLDGPPGFSSYVWSTHSDLSSPLGNTQHVVIPAPGLSLNTTVYAQVIPDNGVGCSDTLSVLVTPYIVKASFPVQAPQCLRNNSFTFTSFSQTNGGSITNYLWNFNDNSTANGQSSIHQFPFSDTFHVSLTATTSDGCIDDTTIDIIVLSSPQLRVNGTNICEGTSSLVTLSGADTYAWNPRSGLSFISPTRDSVYLGINNVTPYTITATDTTSGCDMDSIIQVNYYPNPNADFQQPNPQCLRNNNFIFTNTSTFAGGPNSLVYLWTFGDDSTSNQFSTNHSYDTAGNYIVHLYGISPNGCRDTVVKQITVNAHPSSNVFAIRSLRFCYKDSVTLFSQGQAGSGIIAGYQWLNNGSVMNGCNQSAVTLDTTGAYQLIIENTNGCKDTSLIQPVIAHPLPTGFISTEPSSTYFICNGSEVEIKVNQSTATTYQWYYTDYIGSFPPRIIQGADSASIQVTQPGQYMLELTTSTLPACKAFANDTIKLRLINKPTPDFSFPIYCAGMPIRLQNLTNISQSGPTNWIWDFGDLSEQSTAYSPVHNYNIGTNYTVSLTAVPSYCPYLDSTITLTVNIEEPVPSLRYPTINAVKFTNTALHARNFADSYHWDPRVGLVNGSYNISDPVFNYDHETDYRIHLETIAGCKTVDTQLVRIFVVPDIQVPTAFTPNGDGHNDGLDVFTIGIDKLNFFRIFNRWGQLVYETIDPKKKWDGTYLTVRQPIETYVWIAEGIDQKGAIISRRGQFILIR